jgi:hypothetical protein
VAWDDDEDWVGEPPEGRYTRDRAKPEFWARFGWAETLASLTATVAAIVLVIVLLFS